MKRYILLTSQLNRYYNRFEKAIDTAGVQGHYLLYEKFNLENKETKYNNKRFDGFRKDDLILCRDGGYKYSDKLSAQIRKVTKLADSSDATILDRNVWLTYPRLSDKYNQATIFNEHSIEHVKTILLSKFDKSWDDYPIIAKPRVSAGGKGTKVFETYEDLTQFAERIDKESYICQPFKKVSRDLRVMWIGGKVIGTINREVIRHSDDHVGVKAIEETKLLDKEKVIIEKFHKIEGMFMRGVDLLTDSEGYSWVGEMNVAPIFDRFEEITGIDVVETIVNEMLTI